MTDRHPLRIGFLHPDLGLGGAERLVVDAALCLQRAGHHVTLFTTHHDPARCFEETRDGTLDVHVHGDGLPSQVGQHLRAPCAILRMLSLTWAMALAGARWDVLFCDLVAHVIPLVKYLHRTRVLFYCHFPDQLLVPRRQGLYRLYRLPIDRWEAVGLSLADRVLVNSQFTAVMFRRTFPRLHAVPLEVLSPGVDWTRYQGNGHPAMTTTQEQTGADHGPIMLLSINRYDRNKNLVLAIEALALLRKHLADAVFARVQLVIAGGYDDRLQEHRETFTALQVLVRRWRLDAHVLFVRSCPEAQRLALLQRCQCVVYTPEQEHFGYGPLEAMAAGRPVVAVASGGPRETVQHDVTGLLCPPTPHAFAAALARLLADPRAAARMGQAGRRHVAQHFSREVFGTRLERIVQELVAHAANQD